MSRIRTIKPEFWTSEQVMDCSIEARLAFIGMWNFCDDQGVHPASAKTLKAEVFPADNISVEKVEQIVDELTRNGLISVYEAQNKQWWHVTGWRHQLIKNPSAPKYPPPDSGTPIQNDMQTPEELLSSYPTPTLVVPQSLPITTVGEDPVREGKGREGIKSVNTRKRQTKIPEDFCVSPAVFAWAEKNGHDQLDAHLAFFKDKAKSKGYAYVDWDAAFRIAIAGNWAKTTKTTISHGQENLTATQRLMRSML